MNERLLASTWTPKVPVCWMFFHPIYPRLKLATGSFMLITPFWFPAGRRNQNMFRTVSSFQEVCLPCFLLVFQSRSRVSSKCWYIGWNWKHNCHNGKWKRGSITIIQKDHYAVVIVIPLDPPERRTYPLCHLSGLKPSWSNACLSSMLISFHTAVPQPPPPSYSTPNC